MLDSAFKSPMAHFCWSKPLNISTHNIRVELFHIDVSDGAAGKRPHLGFVFECSSDLQQEVEQVKM